MASLNNSSDQTVKVDCKVTQQTIWTMLDDLGNEEDVDIGDSMPLSNEEVISPVDLCEKYNPMLDDLGNKENVNIGDSMLLSSEELGEEVISPVDLCEEYNPMLDVLGELEIIADFFMFLSVPIIKL